MIHIQKGTIGVAGFKPKEVIELLKIGPQKFRYWRYHLDPNPARSEFSSRDVFAYRLIKWLIQFQGVTVKELELLSTVGLFKWCTSTSMEQAKSTMLIMDLRVKKIEFLPENTSTDEYNLHLRYLPLRDIVTEHVDSLDKFGL